MGIDALRFININHARWQKLAEAAKNGCKITADLGCGSGSFTIKLAAATKEEGRWMVGVDQFLGNLPEAVESGKARAYEEYENIVFIPSKYEEILDDWEKYRFLEGRADRTFMIMPWPTPFKSYKREIELWRRLAAPGGELHLRTENDSVRQRVAKAIALQGLKAHAIPFAAEATEIWSETTMVITRLPWADHYEYGFKLAD